VFVTGLLFHISPSLAWRQLRSVQPYHRTCM
jgi:hypothetical protein